MKMERRRVVYQDGSYQFLKPKDNGNWHEYGERKTLKAIVDAIENERYDLEISSDVEEKVERYRTEQEEKRRRYFLKNNLHQK